MAKILDGKIIRDEIADKLTAQILKLDPKPKLVIIQIGDNPESNTYINQKIKFGEKIGAIVDHQKLAADTSQENLESKINSINSDASVHGIIIQMPIPENLDKEKLINLIDPKKDVDGLTTTNQNLLENNDPKAVAPATAKGVITMLNHYKIPVSGKKVTVVGRSKLVGSPVATLLRNMGAEVTVAHSKTLDLKSETKGADVVVVAVGKPNLITKDHVSPGQAIIDVGINVDQSTGARNLTGDVNFAEVEPIVAAISPVPGGIGPLTVASLFENLLEAYNKSNA